MTISVGESLISTGTGSDPHNNLPLTYPRDFDQAGGSGMPPSTAEDPGSIKFEAPGVFTVTFTVTDNLGLAHPTPATRMVTFVCGTPTLIPQAGWSVWGVDSEDSGYEAFRAFDGSASSIWHTQWSAAQPPPPHWIEIDLGADYDVTGFRYLPRQNNFNSRIGQYEFYLSTDGATWGSAVASGTFANNDTEKQVLFTTKVGQYIRLRALTEVNGKAFTTAAEINVLQSEL